MSNFDHFVGTREVTAQHAFDVTALTTYLDQHMPGFKGPLQVALDVYFEQKSVEVLVDLFKSLNSIDLSSVPCPDALQLSMLVTHQTHTKPTPQICESSQPKLSMITFY